MVYAFTYEVPINPEIYGEITAALGDERAPGFIAHVAYRTDGGLRYLDVWNSRGRIQGVRQRPPAPGGPRSAQREARIRPAGAAYDSARRRPRLDGRGKSALLGTGPELSLSCRHAHIQAMGRSPDAPFVRRSLGHLLWPARMKSSAKVMCAETSPPSGSGDFSAYGCSQRWGRGFRTSARSSADHGHVMADRAGHHQRARIEELRDNFVARINEAEREGWLGEVEGLRVSLAGAEDKFAQIGVSITRRTSNVDLGMVGVPPALATGRERNEK